MQGKGMPHTHVIEAESAEDFKKKVGDLAAALGVGGASGKAVAAEVRAEVTNSPFAEPPAKEAPKSKKAKVEEKTEEPIDPFGKEPEVAADPFGKEEPAAEEALTFDSIKELLTKVNNKGEDGTENVKKILVAVGSRTVSGIKEADYPKVADLANKILKKK